ncbi:hypothetical protein L596_029606 [Steinernema carpocapsae]|uniref:Uncharacterized protein n=1 Tax=Steinernema carpocapsae TaxID=34508 RepID=A0A4U5LV51_STECR|nr:hypothetical protein L596_029606 [Steinernema carpocapsae]
MHRLLSFRGGRVCVLFVSILQARRHERRHVLLGPETNAPPRLLRYDHQQVSGRRAEQTWVDNDLPRLLSRTDLPRVRTARDVQVYVPPNPEHPGRIHKLLNIVCQALFPLPASVEPFAGDDQGVDGEGDNIAGRGEQEDDQEAPNQAPEASPEIEPEDMEFDLEAVTRGRRRDCLEQLNQTKKSRI